MANQGPPSDDPFFRPDRARRNSYADDALPLDAGLTEDDGEDEQPQFRRANKRVPVRRGALPRKTASRVLTAMIVVLVLAALGAAAYEADSFATHSWRFRVHDVELASEAPNSRAQILQKMNESVGRNIFQISLAERKQELEKIPWVESAAVIRLWPNHLRVIVQERTPVAFVALSDRIDLIDAHGVLMEQAPGSKSEYSFPVITGMSDNEPQSTRAPRIKTYMRLMHELDEGNGQAQYSRNLDEVDLSDPDDVKVMAKGGSAPILLHLGTEDFLQRFMVFLSNVQKWEQDHGKLEAVDLRYGSEIPTQFAAAKPAAQPEAAKPEAAKPDAPKPVAKAPAKGGKLHGPQKKRK